MRQEQDGGWGDRCYDADQRSSTQDCHTEVKPMALKQELQEKRAEILAIAEQHGAFNVRIFGSVARGEEREDSDIDFLIDYDLTKTSSWFPVGLIQDLEDLLERKVDVVTAKSLHYFIRDRVLQEAIDL
nr:nucleotidyltransferase family protein [Roseofilum capinflatum]